MTLTPDELAAATMPLPKEGSKAQAALAANAAKPVSRFDKMYKRSKRKPPTKSNLIEGGAAVVPGKLITAENDMYVMSIGMMLGLRVSLYYNASNAADDLKNDDYHGGDHYVFPPDGMDKPGMRKTPKHPLSHTFKFKDYAPKVFHRIRLLSGIDTKSYMQSICGDMNFVQFTTNSKRSTLSPHSCARLRSGGAPACRGPRSRAPLAPFPFARPPRAAVPPAPACPPPLSAGSSSSSRRTGTT